MLAIGKHLSPKVAFYRNPIEHCIQDQLVIVSRNSLFMFPTNPDYKCFNWYAAK